MSKSEVMEAVRDYLRHTGGSELSQLWNGLRRQASPAEIRAALKALGAVARVIGDWPKWTPTGERIPRTYRSSPGRYATDMPNTVERFTVYRLAEVS